ncbi:MAG: glycosyl hydrolase [Candidatus Marinimicrobia bacterium]|nr:glycosyl hydrolase [Candidatus Neomarinimicrobiota bacterium]
MISPAKLKPTDLGPELERLWAASAGKIRSIERTCPPGSNAPVFTVKGRYTARGWTEWTQGFQYGAALLQFDATGDEEFLELGRLRTVERMASHLTHTGVHDHGFNNVSTYGNLLRLADAGRIAASDWEREYYTLALKVSGAVQAMRWTALGPDQGYIYSFNGPHSLFADTIRSLRALAWSHQLGHTLMGENDRRIPLLERWHGHIASTLKFNVYYGKGRDTYDLPGRVAHESIFNLNDGAYRCPSSQQGFSPFTTWTRGLAWVLLGCAEQLEFNAALPAADLKPFGGRRAVMQLLLKGACATANFYLEQTPTDGIPYWDTGAPGLARLGDYLDRPADPFNPEEPVDSSAAAISAQGLLRLGRFLINNAGQDRAAARLGRKYLQAGLTTFKTLCSPTYLSTSPRHQGLLLHGVYHRPNGWDYVPPRRKVPCGEACMWGDYHLRELALWVQRAAEQGPYYTFFGDQS